MTAEEQLVQRLRARDEAAFMDVVRQHHGALLRLARAFLPDGPAEETVQETWIALLEGIDQFEERSSLKTWLTRVLLNKAKTRAVKEGRVVPLSSLEQETAEGESAVPPDRFQPDGHWALPPFDWRARSPEGALMDAQVRAVIEAAIARLPAMQRSVITLRDVEGWDGPEVCNALTISESNQRVLLHRARSAVRAALEKHLDGVG